MHLADFFNIFFTIMELNLLHYSSSYTMTTLFSISFIFPSPLLFSSFLLAFSFSFASPPFPFSSFPFGFVLLCLLSLLLYCFYIVFSHLRNLRCYPLLFLLILPILLPTLLLPFLFILSLSSSFSTFHLQLHSFFLIVLHSFLLCSS